MKTSKQSPQNTSLNQAKQRRLLILVFAAVAVSFVLLFAGKGSITAVGNGRVSDGLLALYTFEQGSDAGTVYDVSGAGSALDLTIASGDTTWLSDGGLAVNGSSLIESPSPAAKIIQAVQDSDALTLEAWIAPDSVTQDGPARIVSISDGQTTRNLTLGQGLWNKKPKTVYDVRLRTAQSDNNGLPSLTTAEGTAQASMQHVVLTYSSGQRNLYVDGQLANGDSQAGTLNNWDGTYKLLLGNEADGSRPWIGELHLVAFYDRALGAAEVAQNYEAGPRSSSEATPTHTPDAPTETAVPPTSTTEAPTETPLPPSETPLPPTDTPAPPTATSIPDSGAMNIFVSSSTGGTVGGVKFADEDILQYDSGSGAWSMFLDGSDIGLSDSAARDIDAFHLYEDNTILFSVTSATMLPDVGSVDDSDIIRFVPISLGSNTSGSLSLFFDGSDVGLTTDGEDVDALHVMDNGDMLISTSGAWSAGGLNGVDEDLLLFSPNSLGSGTSGSWSLYFDGSDVGLDSSASEDLWGLWLDSSSSAIYLRPKDTFSVSGVKGDGADILICQPLSLGSSTDCAFSLEWDGSTHGIGGEQLDGLSLRGAGAGGLTPVPSSTPAPTNTPAPATPTVPSGGGKSEMLVYEWDGLVTKQEKGFPRHHPPTENGDWTKPVNFANGTFHMRVIIRSQPIAQEMRLQYCVWQDRNALETCTRLATVMGTKGTTVTWSHEIDKMWKKNKQPIDWTRERFKDGVAIKNSSGKPVSPFQNWNWNGENPDDWYPINWLFQVVVVAKGETFSGWQNYD